MPAQPYVFQAFPSYRYGPNGEAEVFESEADVPEGWLDHPSKFNAPEADAPTAKATPQKRQTAAEKKAAAAEAAAAEAAAKAAADADLDSKTDEELAELLKGYGYEVDGAARADIIAVIRDERAKA